MTKNPIYIILFLSNFCFGFQSKKTETDSITYYKENKNPIKAINFAKKQAESYLKKGNFKKYCDLKYEQALLYESFSDVENAIKILFESRKIAEANHLYEKLVDIHWKIGNLYTTSFEFQKAHRHLHKAKKNAEKLKDTVLLSKTHQGLCRYHGTVDSDSMKYYMDKVAQYTKNSKDLKEKSKAYDNYVFYYNKLKKFDLAKEYAQKSIETALLTKDPVVIGTAKVNTALIEMEGKHNYKKAIEIYESVLKLFPNNENTKIVASCFLNASYAYEKIGNYKKALEYSNKYFELYDSMINGRIEKATREIETKYQLDKAALIFKEKENIIIEKQKRNQNISLLLAFLLLLSGLIFYFYNQNLVLKQKNKLKNIDNDLQFKIISATLDGQDQERNKISQVLHDNVSATLSSVGLHLSAFETSLSNEQREDLKKTRLLLKQAHDKVRDLSHELVSPLLVKFGLQFALSDLCEKNSNSLLKITYHSLIPNSKKFDIEFETKIYYIVSELINNIIKHSQATEAQLNVYEENDYFCFVLKDNGKGFENDSVHKTEGFGLTQIKARVKNMQGTIVIKSKKGEGTAMIIKVKE